MASTYSPSLRLELMVTGDQSGTWGDTTNTNLGTLLEQAITGYLSKAMADANQTLTNLNGASDEARNMVVEATGALTAGRDMIVPTAEKVYLIKNSTTGGFAVTVKTSAGTGVAVYPGQSRWVVCDGTNVIDGSVPKFASSQFLIADATDFTKLLAFNVASVATGTTRTITIPNGSGTASLLGLAETFSGVKTFSAIPVLSGGGITFPATQVPSANANTLDDYAEGTFTPVVAFGGASVGITYAADSQQGRYIKIGSKVTIWVYIVTTSKGSSTGTATIAGLPFAAKTVTNMLWSTGVGYRNFPWTAAGVLSGRSVINLYNGITALTDADFLSASEFAITLEYEAAN